MSGSFIDREISRTNRNLLIMSGGAIAIVLGIFALSWRYYYNYFAGPFPADAAALAEIEDPKAETRRLLAVHGERMVPTGLQEITVTRSKYTNREKSRRTSASFGALVLGKRLLLVKAPGEAEGTDWTGEIVPIPADIRARLMPSAEARAAFLPYMLDGGRYRTGGTVGLVLCGLVLLFAGWSLRGALRRIADPSLHPIMVRLKVIGEPAALAARLDGELATAQGPRAFGEAKITPSFLLRTSGLTLDVCLLDDIVWAHGKVTQHRTNGIPTGKTFAVIIHDRHRTTFELPCGKDEVLKAFLQELSGRAPWALFGHSDDLEKAWAKTPAEVIAAVERRRSERAGA
jgi:hypothetical protein